MYSKTPHCSPPLRILRTFSKQLLKCKVLEHSCAEHKGGQEGRNKKDLSDKLGNKVLTALIIMSALCVSSTAGAMVTKNTSTYKCDEL
jgi:hypothetical protein